MINKTLSSHPKYRFYKKIRKDGLNQFRVVPYTRRLAAKYYCLECVGYSYPDMASCTVPECPLYGYRFGKLPDQKTAYDRMRAIVRFCRECNGEQRYVDECKAEFCPLYPYRLSGYKTDKSTLIPASKVNFLPEYREAFNCGDQKSAV